jgi:hypothetical protein
MRGEVTLEDAQAATSRPGEIRAAGAGNAR